MAPPRGECACVVAFASDYSRLQLCQPPPCSVQKTVSEHKQSLMRVYELLFFFSFFDQCEMFPRCSGDLQNNELHWTGVPQATTRGVKKERNGFMWPNPGTWTRQAMKCQRCCITRAIGLVRGIIRASWFFYIIPNTHGIENVSQISLKTQKSFVLHIHRK